MRPSSGALKNCSNSLWCMTLDGVNYPIRAFKVDGFRTKSYRSYDLVRKPSNLGALIGYFTPSHIIHQRLLLQFLSAVEDGSKTLTETCRVILQLLINILPSCITLVLCIYYRIVLLLWLENAAQTFSPAVCCVPHDGNVTKTPIRKQILQMLRKFPWKPDQRT